MTDLILPAQLTTELQAVNTLITSMGEEPFASIDPSPSPDVDKAIQCLQEANSEVQARGWKWNQEVAFPITPDPVALTISLPDNCLEVAKAYYIPGPESNSSQQPLDIVARGTQLYDRYRHSYQFTSGVTIYLDMTLLLEWAQVPEKARRVITLEAVKKFQSRDQMSSPTLQVNESDLARAWALLEQGADQEAQYNQIYGNVDTISKIMGTGSLRRGRLNG